MIDSPTKKKIANAFMEVLSRKSFSAIKVKDIVEEAGISHMTFYRNFSDKYDLVAGICYEDMMLFTKIYGRNAEWKAITICILNTMKNNSSFYGKILKDEEACDYCMQMLARVSRDTTGAKGSDSTYFAWKGVLQKWAKGGFTESVDNVYTELVAALPLHEVFTGDELTAVIRSYEANTLDDFRNRNKNKPGAE